MVSCMMNSSKRYEQYSNQTLIELENMLYHNGTVSFGRWTMIRFTFQMNLEHTKPILSISPPATSN